MRALLLLVSALPIIGQPTLRQFDAASIRPVQRVNLRQLKPGEFEGLQLKITPGLVRMPYEPLYSVISLAFGTTRSQLAAPEWSKSSLWSITATIPKGATEKDVPEMLRNMLTSRFGMTYHRETRATQSLALTVAKDGLKAKKASREEAATSEYASDQLHSGGVHWELSSTASGLADFLRKETNLPVIDKTGLEGIYTWSWDYYFAGGLDVDRNFLNPTPSTNFSLNKGAWHNEGLQKMGLQVTQTTAPLENVVIDRLDRTPTEN